MKDDSKTGQRTASDKDTQSDADLTATLLRLLVGAAGEGADSVLRRLSPAEAQDAADGEDPDDRAEVRARHVLIGLLFEAYGAASRQVSAAGRVVETAGRFWGSILGSVARSRLFDPVRTPYEFLVERGSDELERWARIGRAEEQRSRELTRSLVMAPVEDIVAYLRDNPEMEKLVRRQAESLLAELDDDPTLAALIQAQGDRYVEHLQENPEAIQELVRGQSMGLAEELANTVRTRTVTADTLLEHYVRTILRRTPRRELPEVPERIREQAEHPGTGSDD